MRTAITGGIGSGKSYVCRLLKEQGIEVFNCDLVAKDIIATDNDVRDRLTALINAEDATERAKTATERAEDDATGTEAAADAPRSGHIALTKESLGAYIRSGADKAAKVNAIVHPRVAQAFNDSGLQWMECAILFESGFDRLVDRIVVVTCPTEERIRRIVARDHCDQATALRWMALQMTDEERLARATAHIVNDGQTPIEPQIASLLTCQ